MSSQTIQTMPFTKIIAFKSYLDNLGKPLNSTLNLANFNLQVSIKQKETSNYMPHIITFQI